MSKIFIPNFVCVQTNKRYETYRTECSFYHLGHAPGLGLGVLGVKNLSVRICDGAPSTARSSLDFGSSPSIHQALRVYSCYFRLTPKIWVFGRKLSEVTPEYSDFWVSEFFFRILRCMVK